MKLALVLIVAMLSPMQAPFARFSYCREFPRGQYEKQCVVLTPDGAGQSQLKNRGAAQTESQITLSPSGRTRFLAVIAATNNLQDARNYETKRKVANLGQKHLTLELPGGPREATFNYSDLKEVNALATFFDGLLNQLTLTQEMEIAIRYERLSVPARLESLEADVKAGRVGDPEGLIPLLDKIIQNDQILSYAKENAQKIKVLAQTPIKEK